MLHDTLDGQGYTLLIAKNGKIALKIAREAKPSLILLDIMMPEMDGYEVCRRLKADQTSRYDTCHFSDRLTRLEDEAKGLGPGCGRLHYQANHPDRVGSAEGPDGAQRLPDHLEHQEIKRQTRDLALTQAVMIESLLATLAEYRDPETGGHIKRTQNYVKALAVRLKDHPRFRHELTDEAIDLLYLFGSAPTTSARWRSRGSVPL